ncbi:MAG: PepSY domain-containing protein [Paracoccaceae bacterium]|nr:PepSY domain-containing protein [Paracoccaceae bacterium]
MTHTFAKPLVLALALAVSAAPVLAASADAVPQATQDAVRAKLVAEGYDVRSIQMEDGRIEVYALKDGQKLEIYLDAALNVVETKIED